MMYRSEKKLTEGFVSIILADGEYEVHVDASEWGNVKDAFTNGKAFVEAKDLQGATQIIKVSRFSGIALITPEAIAKKIEIEKEEDEFDKDQSLKGGI
jgi:hypothetical protein